MSTPGLWSGTLYLARRELRRTWRSYIWALAMAPLMGATAAFLVGADPGNGSEFRLSPMALGLLFIALIAVLPRTSAWHSGEGGHQHLGASSGEHLSFLRALPLSAHQIAAARTLVAAVSVLALRAAFFAALYALSAPLRDELGVAEYLLFGAFWAGCALAFEALGVFMELGLFGWLGFWVYLVAIWFSASLVSGFFVGRNGTIISAVSGLIREHGAAPALGALGVGCGALALSWLATTRRLRRKEIGG